jgi:hypothetical protein
MFDNCLDFFLFTLDLDRQILFGDFLFTLSLECLPNSRRGDMNLDFTLTDFLFELTSLDALGTGNEGVVGRRDSFDRLSCLRNLVRDQSQNLGSSIVTSDRRTRYGNGNNGFLWSILIVFVDLLRVPGR